MLGAIVGDIVGSVYEFDDQFRSKDFEGAIRDAVSIGGGSDTLAAMTGSIAEAKWGVPKEIRREALKRMDEALFETYQRFIGKIVKRLIPDWPDNSKG